MTRHIYQPPLDKLLTYGDPRETPDPADDVRHWPDYPGVFGLGAEHVPELIRMATDDTLTWADSDSLEVWAPIHAWRALGQLHAEAAAQPLLPLLLQGDDSDWVLEELPDVYGLIGAAAIPALSAYLADASHPVYAHHRQQLLDENRGGTP